jgi:hypothetical protein
MSLEVCLWIAFIGLAIFIGWWSSDGHVSFDDGEGCLGFSIIAIIIAIVLYTCSN